jgi:lipopolysaccharide transport system ATP-binding protein
MSYIIKVENLGKKYSIQHQGERERYVALRDVLAGGVKGLGSSVVRGIRSWIPGLGYSSRGNGNGSGPPSPVLGQPDTRHPTPNTPHPPTEDFWALRDVSFEVKQGEVVGIIGRNGAGKSTLLKILSRITEPTEGRVRIRGRVASLLEVGTGFHPELTGRENIFVNGAILGMTRAEIAKKFDEIVAFAEIETFLDTPVKRYSSGMYVRLAFAVAAHLEPEILIVDEVLAVGDDAFQKKCIGKMEDVGREGRTILFVSHNMSAIETLCRRGILLEGGTLSSDTSPHEAVTQYLRYQARKHVAVFEHQSMTPSITKVLVDEEELLDGNIIVDIEFESPYPLAPAVPGIVLYDDRGVPVFGSNPRIHADGFEAKTASSGKLRFEVFDIPLARGKYLLSVWLGDWHQDYDHKVHALSVDFPSKCQNARSLPAALVGSLNWPVQWRS